jgi:TonB family protein
MRTIQSKWAGGRFQSKFTRRKVRRVGRAWLEAAAVGLALIVAGATAQASTDRAVKMRVAPTYPELAKRMKITGTVRLEATIDADGKVTSVKTLSGSKALSQAAEDAVSKWKFAAGSAPSTEEVDVNFAFGQ